MEDTILEYLREKNRKKTQLPEGKELLMYLSSMFLVTGREDVMFCNVFCQESIQLLVNAIFLYEEGFFDCAFYSVRQAGEVMDTMLYLANCDTEEFAKWNKKEKFSMDSKIKKQLQKLNLGYKEVSESLKEYFEYYRNLIKKINKIIHKQGVDTFYAYQFMDKNDSEKDKLFVEYLEYTIGFAIIIFVILDPISLILADKNFTMRLHFDPITEAIDLGYFERFLGIVGVPEKIMDSHFYKDFSEQFETNEEMNSATYSVIRENAWDINRLDDIEKQLSLLSIQEQYMFWILKAGIKVTKFYYMKGLDWYITSYESRFYDRGFCSEDMKPYIDKEEEFNQHYGSRYISTIKMYDDNIMLEHDDKLSEYEIELIKNIETELNQQWSHIVDAAGHDNVT